jgi:hypothetical protein
MFLLATWAILAANTLPAAAMSEKECTAAGGKWIAKKGTCTETVKAGEASSSDPQPQEGITITGCVPSASGDPLKGLNVDKGTKNSGGSLCP